MSKLCWNYKRKRKNLKNGLRSQEENLKDGYLTGMMKVCDQDVQEFPGSGPADQRVERDLAEETGISPLPADTDHGADIPFYTAAGGVEDPGDFRIEQLADAQQIVFIFQTQFDPIAQISVSPVSRINSERTNKQFDFPIRH